MRVSRRVLGVAALLTATALCPPLAAETKTHTVQVSATILPRLELSVKPETGADIAFGAIEQPATGQQVSRSVRVSVGVFSNLDRPYHVTQLVRRPLTNAQGETMAVEQFQVTTPPAALGRTAASVPVTIEPGTPTTLYLSNERGKSNSFQADYILTVTPTTPAGDYRTEIVYTVTSL